MEIEPNDAPEKNDQPDDDNGDESSVKSKKKPAGLKEWILRFGAVGNLGVQVINISMTFLGPPFNQVAIAQQIGRGCVYTSSGIGAINSPVVIYKERHLTKENTFRETLNGIREQQGRLAEQNDILSAEVDELEADVKRMQDVEAALRKLSDVQGTQINELLDLVRQNKEINEGMRSVLKSKALEEVISLVLDIDNDGSFTVKDSEIDRLIIGMNLIDGMKFDAQAFKADVIACGGLIEKVITMITTMINGGSDGEDGSRTTCQIEIEDPEEWLKKQKRSGMFVT